MIAAFCALMSAVDCRCSLLSFGVHCEVCVICRFCRSAFALRVVLGIVCCVV